MLGQRYGWSTIGFGAQGTGSGQLYSQKRPGLGTREANYRKMPSLATTASHWAANPNKGMARANHEPHISVRVTGNSSIISHVRNVKLRSPRDASIAA